MNYFSDINVKLTFQERYDLFAALCFWINMKPNPEDHQAIEGCRERMSALRDKIQKTVDFTVEFS